MDDLLLWRLRAGEPVLEPVRDGVPARVLACVTDEPEEVVLLPSVDLWELVVPLKLLPFKNTSR